MLAYLKFFELERSPFEGKAQAQVVIGTRALRDAFALIRAGLDEGDARICVSGGPGLGKTSLARALPKLLGDAARVAVVLDPGVSWESLRGSIAKQWGLATAGLARAALIEAARDRRLVLVIDQAECASEEFLDHLDVVLSYRSENDEPVVQSILLVRLSASERQDPAPIVWWLDRIQTLQLELAPLPREGIESYIHKHLERAGWRGERLFTEGAALAIHRYTAGVPGKVSRLCERLLAEAAARDHHHIDDASVHALCDEGEPAGESGLEDEFEEIVLGEEFDDAGETRDSESPKIEAVQHEPSDEVEAWDQTDESQVFQDDYLSAPASPEELRAILGSVLGRHGRAFAAAAIAAVIGGLAFAWLAGDAGPSGSSAPDNSELAGYERTGPPESDSTGHSESLPAVLARLRGPVSTTTQIPTAPAASRSASANASPPPRVLELSDEEFEEEISEDELVDMRPAALLPGATQKSPSAERIW
jgi:type II secretory pathway predicted ATPase ExeA